MNMMSNLARDSIEECINLLSVDGIDSKTAVQNKLKDLLSKQDKVSNN